MLKRNGRDEEELMRLRKEFKEAKKRKVKKWRDEMEKEVKGIRNEGQVWEFINKERKKRRGVTEKFG